MQRAVTKLAEFLSAVDLLTCTSKRRLSTIWRCRGLQSPRNPPMRRTPHAALRRSCTTAWPWDCPASPDFDPRYPITALPFPRSALAGLIPGSFGKALRLCCCNLSVAVGRTNTQRRFPRTTSPSDPGRAGVNGARLSDNRVTKTLGADTSKKSSATVTSITSCPGPGADCGCFPSHPGRLSVAGAYFYLSRP